MSFGTLHLYNLQNKIDLDFYIKFVSKNDLIVLLLPETNNLNTIEIPKPLLKYKNKLYLVSSNTDYLQLVNLVMQYKRVFTWK